MECAIFVGLPGSGKTTFYRTHLAGTHRHVSKDNFPRARNRNARQLALIDSALSEGTAVAVDNTNPTPGVRAPLIERARHWGASVVAYYFDADRSECIRRNRARSGRARVPDVAIYATARRLVPPLRAEGFDRILVVRITGDKTFQIAE